MAVIRERSDRTYLPPFPLSGTVQAAPPATLQDTTYFEPQPHRWNAKAVASLPVAVGTVAAAILSQSITVLLLGGAIAFLLALIGGLQCRDRGDRGKGYAIAAMVLSTTALFIGLMVVLLTA